MTSDCQFDKEGRQNFRENAKKRERTTFLREKELIVFIKIEHNIFLDIVGGYYKNKN